MKLVKMSLAAALLMSASAFAIENTKVSGDAQLMYQTGDAKDATLFDKDASSADAGVHLSVTTDLLKSVSAGASFTALSTLGLENNLVSGVWGTSHGATAGTGADYASGLGGAKVENAAWFNQAWLAYTRGKTTAKLGRMELDTPLAFTETWTIERNSFEAAVIINQDIPDTTLVGAFIGNGNGTETFGQDVNGTVSALELATGGIVNENGTFTTFGTDGAYAVGLVNNSWEPLTVQAWYYDVSRLAQAYWVQADLSLSGILAGVQYSGIDVNTADVTSSVYAVMLGYEMKDTVIVKASYSAVDKDFRAGFNTATNAEFAQSKLYTEAWWNYGRVTQKDSTSINFTAEGNVMDVVDLGLYYTSVDQSEEAGDFDLSELTLSASKSFGAIDTSLVYINAAVADADADNIVQVYLTLNY